MASRLLVHWVGRSPKPGLAEKLSAQGLRLENALRAGVVARVVFTSRAGEAPSPPSDDLPWLWVSERPVAQRMATEAVLGGAYDVISLDSPGAPEQIGRRVKELQVPSVEPRPTSLFVGKSESSRRVLEQVARAARTSMPVLLTGETGTGKEVSARLIHDWSSRRERRFVPINCAAIPNELMEAQLFGYARGAFSGAVQRYEGLLIAAEGGTVFLDEIDDTPLSLQVKLLRVVQDRVVSRLGENKWHEVDFRIVAASNRDLRRLIRAGAFGADLYERLAIVSIRLPPLRERQADLPDLIAHFIEKFYREEPDGGKRERVRGVSPQALAALSAYPWPGNVRELRNLLFEALVYKRAGDELLLSDLPRRVLRRGADREEKTVVDRATIGRRMEAGTMNLRETLEQVERIALAEALQRAGGSPTRAARLLGEVGRGASSDPAGTVRAMMRRLGLVPDARRRD